MNLNLGFMIHLFFWYFILRTLTVYAAELSSIDAEYIRELEVLLARADVLNQEFVNQYRQFASREENIESGVKNLLDRKRCEQFKKLTTQYDNSIVHPALKLIAGRETSEIHLLAISGFALWYGTLGRIDMYCLEAHIIGNEHYKECPGPTTLEGQKCRTNKLNDLFEKMDSTNKKNISDGDNTLQKVRDDITHLKNTRKSMLKREWNACVENPDCKKDVDTVYNRALQAGATPMREPMDEFYGDRSGGVKDPSGNQWWIATHKEDLSPEELTRRAEVFFKKQQP